MSIICILACCDGYWLIILTEMVEVEGIVPGNRTVQSGLEICGPAGFKLVGSSPVLFAHSGDPTVHTLNIGQGLLYTLSKPIYELSKSIR